MATVLMPLPDRDFDPTEVAISWRVLTDAGHRVLFATPNGAPARADDIMLTGFGLDRWGRIPVLRRVRPIGLMLRANRDARRAYRALEQDPAFRAPLRWAAAQDATADALLLPGGHRARGMRAYLESPVLHALVARYFAADMPVGAICHGVLLAARSRRADGRSVLHGLRTTALTWDQEGAADRLARFGRPWDPAYYRTYEERADEPTGYMSVQQEVTRALADPAHFLAVPRDAPHHRRKTSGLHRDTAHDARPAWVVVDGKYVSARWPGDAHSFAKTLGDLLPRTGVVS